MVDKNLLLKILKLDDERGHSFSDALSATVNISRVYYELNIVFIAVFFGPRYPPSPLIFLLPLLRLRFRPRCRPLFPLEVSRVEDLVHGAKTLCCGSPNNQVLVSLSHNIVPDAGRKNGYPGALST